MPSDTEPPRRAAAVFEHMTLDKPKSLGARSAVSPRGQAISDTAADGSSTWCRSP